MAGRMLYDCKTSDYSAYFEGAVDLSFRKQYKGVIVNACNDGGYGHFAIRKPSRKVFGRMFPRDWIMWKNRREKWYGLRFSDSGCSIEIDADMKNPSVKKIKFDKDTYVDLKDHIPEFLASIGFKFDTTTNEGGISLTIKERWFEIVKGKCVVPEGVTEIADNLFNGCPEVEEIVLPEGLTRIGNCAFFECSHLRSVTIPGSVKDVGRFAFFANSIRDIRLTSGNPDDYLYLEDALRYRDYEKMTLHVPQQAEIAYGNHPFFMQFKGLVH